MTQITDPNTIYTLTIIDSMATGGSIGETFIGETFEAARDNPRYSKTVLMACVLAGWFAALKFNAIGVVPEDR